MFVIHPLDGAFQRVDRAQEHFSGLQRHISAIRQRYADAARIHFDPDPPHRANVYPSAEISYPPILSIALGEICYNLRSALDYLVFELAREDSGVIQDGTQFPIDDTPQKFAKHVPTRLKGLNAAHVSAIDMLQPYNGCTWTKLLRTISNPDKHRTLTPRGSTFNVEIVEEAQSGVAFVPNFSTIRHAKRPDGIEVQVELVGFLNIIVPVNIHPTLGILGDDVEVITVKLITEVRDLLQAFKPEFQTIDMTTVRHRY
jgi:hypothetical protein